MSRQRWTASCLAVAMASLTFPSVKAADETLTWQGRAKGCSERFAHVAVWDTEREEMLLIGGEGRKDKAFIFFNDLWTYSPVKDEWKQLEIKEQAQPSARAYHACTWDSKRNQVWLFGGAGGDFKGLDDLWTFDSKTRRWTAVEAQGPRPKGRLSSTLQYYPEKDVLLMFGGLGGFAGGAPALRELWVFDIKEKKWTEKKCAAPQLWQCASALDPKSGLLMIYGGFDGGFRARSETWVYDVAKDEWREPVKSERMTDAHTGIWDPLSKSMIVYGGARKEQGAKGYDEVWSFDPNKNAWQQLRIKGDAPGGRAYHSAVWDPVSKSMLIFGGTENQFSDPPRQNVLWQLPLHKENKP